MAHRLVESLAGYGIEFGDAVATGMLAFLRSRKEMGEDLSDAWIRGFNSAYLLQDINKHKFAVDYFQDPTAFQEVMDEYFLQIKTFVDIVLAEEANAT